MNLADLHTLPPTIGAKEVSEIMGIGINQTYELARIGDLPVLRLGRTLRFPTARIAAMLGVEIDSRAGPPDEENGPRNEAAPKVIRNDDTQETTTGHSDSWGDAR